MQNFFAKITVHNQFNEATRTITWRDPQIERWEKIYSKLQFGDRGFILGNGFVYSGVLDAVVDKDSLIFKEVETFELRADRFLSIDAISPEINAQLKGAITQPYIFEGEINYEAFKKTALERNFINFYVVKSDALKQFTIFKENDRIIAVNEELEFETFFKFHNGDFLTFMKEDDLFNVEGKSIYEVIQIFELVNAGKTFKNASTNVALLKRIKDTFESGAKLFKFNSFAGYYNIIHNKKALIYSRINLESYFVVGSVWNSKDEQIERFVSNSIWQNGYEDKFIDQVKSIPISSKIAIKAPYTEGSKSVMKIKARGVVTANPKDGRNLSVKWEDDFTPFKVNFSGGYRSTIHKVSNPDHIKAIFLDDDEPFLEDNEFIEGVDNTEIPKIDLPVNMILYGPPGTGKTYKIQDQYKPLFTDCKDEKVVSKRYDFITFHSNYSYEDFIEGLKPLLAIEGKDSSELRFTREPGIFYNVCEKAIQLAGYTNMEDCLADAQEARKEKLNKAPQYALFIDEINRANISRVFGELITLIEDDKRLGANNEIIDTRLPSSKKPFGIPINLHIIGTMNTADKSIALLDIALRRRFEFEGLYPTPDLLDELLKKDLLTLTAVNLLKQINKKIYEKKKSADFLIGQAYFIRKQDNELETVLRKKVVPLLMEYFSGKTEEVSKIFDGSPFAVSYDTGNFDWSIN
jgi:hypothetical protein